MGWAGPARKGEPFIFLNLVRAAVRTAAGVRTERQTDASPRPKAKNPPDTPGGTGLLHEHGHRGTNRETGLVPSP